MSAPTTPAVRPDDVVPVDDPPEPQVIDTEVSERLLDWPEARAWLDQHTGGEWRRYRVFPPYVHCFGRRMFDVRELREWIRS